MKLFGIDITGDQAKIDHEERKKVRDHDDKKMADKANMTTSKFEASLKELEDLLNHKKTAENG